MVIGRRTFMWTMTDPSIHFHDNTHLWTYGTRVAMEDSILGEKMTTECVVKTT